MKKKERREIILNEVHLHNRVLLSDLTNILNVSMDTVRRDLMELDKHKLLKKVHGGAVSNGFNIHSDQNREIYEYENKSIIAKKGISLLNHGDVVLITGYQFGIGKIAATKNESYILYSQPSYGSRIT